MQTHRKDNFFVQKRLMQNLHIAEAHTALDIFRFAVFLEDNFKNEDCPCPQPYITVIVLVWSIYVIVFI